MNKKQKFRGEREYHVGDKIEVNDKMQRRYVYVLSAPMGEDFAEGFRPEVSPAEMLRLGVFEGKYLNDCRGEFPREWYENAEERMSVGKADAGKNCFGVKSRQPLSVWRERGWIGPGDPDVRGWFQWYCRYWLGRRDEKLDGRQIRRWRAFRRHRAQVKKNCKLGDVECRKKQRQALLQWAYDPFI